jgi:transposase-like protein
MIRSRGRRDEETAYSSSDKHTPKGELEEYAVSEAYQDHAHRGEATGEEGADTLPPTLEEIVRDGARRMLADALEAEVTAFLGRDRYARGAPFRGYRNGTLPERELTVGVTGVPVRVPRVSDVPPEVAPDGFQSQLVHRYGRVSKATQALFARLYLEGLATGDFEPVFRELVGETTALSPAAIVRLKDCWAAEYATWRARPLDGHTYAYIWADGVYLGAGIEREKSALLCVLGAREDGTKELLAIELGYRESSDSWGGVLRDLRDRGLSAPRVAVGDGGLGLWAALGEVFPETEHQRCWNHRVLNVQDKLPKRLQAEARARLQAMTAAETQAECERLRDAYAAELREQGQSAAAECLERDWADFVTYYRFPKEHWIHLRTSNPIESVFSAVRLRTQAAKRLRTRENALYLVFKIIERLGQRWRALNGGENLMALVIAGWEFRDGLLVKPTEQQEEEEAAPAAKAA